MKEYIKDDEVSHIEFKESLIIISKVNDGWYLCFYNKTRNSHLLKTVDLNRLDDSLR